MKYSQGRPRKPSAAPLAALLLLAACGRAPAAAPVSLEAIAGFGGVLRAGRWAPFIVTVDNRGPALEAVLSLEVFRGSELRGTLAARDFQRTVSIPARSRRRFSFAAPVVAVPRPAVATLSVDGREIARREIELHPAAVNERVIVALSSEIVFDVLAREGARVVYPHPENLPESWIAWSGVDLVVLRDTAFHRPTAAQAAALEGWVRSGGRLVATGGAAALQLDGSPLARLLPVELLGLEERGGLAGLARLGGGVPATGRWILARAAARAGATVLAAEGDLPLAVTRRLGRGAVTWIAYDPADPRAAAWPGNAALWNALAGDAAAVAAADESPREPLDDPWIAPLAAGAGVSFPSHGALAAFLAAFLAPAAALLLLPRRPSRRLHAVLLAAVAAAAAAGGWLAFNRWGFRGDDFLLEAARVDARDGTAILSRRIAVCSPSGDDFTLALGPGDVRVEDLTSAGEQRPAGSLAVNLDGDVSVRAGFAGRFQSRLLATEAVIPFALSASLEGEAGAPRLAVENLTGATLRGAFLADRGAYVALGDLPPGGRVRLAVGDAAPSLAIGDAVRRASWEREAGSIGRDGPVLVGWLDEVPSAARLVGVPAAASVCLVTVEVTAP